MRKTIFAFAALAAFMIVTPSFAASTDNSTETSFDAKDNGGYVAKEKAESTDANGTTVKHNTTKKVDVDNKGNKETTVDIKSSNDPKGLFNKTSTEVKNKAVEKDGKTEYSHKKIVNGKTVEENNDTQESR